jgi:hypothetical protein
MKRRNLASFLVSGLKFTRLKCCAFSTLLVLLLGTGVLASADPILLNGDFSTPNQGGGYTYSPTGADWTFAGGSGIQANGSAWGFTSAPVGTQTAFLQGVGSVSQDITGLVAGQGYTVSFYLEQRPNYGVDPVTVSVGGVNLLSGVDSPANWTLYTETFIATNPTELLNFSTSIPNFGGDYDAGVSGVSVAVAATPEPGSIILLGSGLLGLFGAVRRKFGKNI